MLQLLRNIRELFGAACFGTCMLSLLGADAAAAQNPNIVFILADDLGYGDVASYNPESKIKTPNLDRLANEGIRFTDAHSPSTVCTPSRYSLLTGRMCFRTGFRGVFTGVDGPLIEQGRLTVAQLLKDQGYSTACVGKWHIGATFFDQDGHPVPERGGGVNKVRQVDWARPFRNGPVDVGFDYFFGTISCPTTDWLYAYLEGDKIVEEPTEVVEPKTDHWLEYEHFRTGLKAPGFEFENVDLKFLEKSQAFLERHVQNHPHRPFFLFHSTQAVHLPALPAKQFVGSSGAGPLGDFIVEFDFIVGELMKTLDELGVSENTLFIVSSDNGPEIVIRRMRETSGHDSARPWRGMKRDNWEGGHRVPFIARWPGRIPEGSVSEETICLTDFMATVAAILNREIPPDAGEDSFNILSALTGEKADEPFRPFTLHQTMSNALAIRRGDWKLLDHPGSGGNDYTSEWLRRYAVQEEEPDATRQLYHLEKDPGETTNLIRARPEEARQLQRLLDRTREAGTSRISDDF